jgi:Protein of unknown function (DUF664)
MSVQEARQPVVRSESDDLVETLRTHRDFLRHTVAGLTDDQAASRPTVSELCLGGLIKHVAMVEHRWAEFISVGAAAVSGFDEASTKAHADSFRMFEGESLSDLLGVYNDVAEQTDRLVSELASLDGSHPLPDAPWFEVGARWSHRRVVLHIIAETAQHAGHADILREAIDGRKTMG